MKLNGPDESMRLSKFLSQQGVCSRREADQYIENQQILINDKPAVLGQRVGPSDSVEVLKAAKENLESKITIAIYKPVGYVSGHSEGDYKPAHTLIREENLVRTKPWHKPISFEQRKSLAPVGRLDIDSKGLLLLSQDGAFVKSIIGPDNQVEKEYEVFVEGDISDEKIKLLSHGLELDGKALKPAKVTLMEEQKLKITLIEGKKRQIRRMCELVDLEVKSLKRTRIGNHTLAPLTSGQWTYID
ncbi:MAG: rRNA pseudouridine synthase [Bdellovibrionales bacterium]|nr:rRNA pseudouridine synthase [Bdellovibrionales bacterium]